MGPREQISNEDANDIFKSLGLDDDDFKSELSDDELAQAPADDGDDFDSKSEEDTDFASLEEPTPPVAPPTPPEKSPVEELEKQPIPSTAVGFDARGNVIDKRTNRVLARAGAESRLYMDKQKLKDQVAALAPRVGELEDGVRKAVEIARGYRSQLEAFEQRDREFGLQPEQRVEAMRMYAMSEKDPVSFFKEVLTRAQLRGIDLTSLGLKNGSGGLDASALARQLSSDVDAKLKPLLADTQLRQQQAKTEDEAKQRRVEIDNHVRSFFQTTPDAVPHWQEIKAVLANPLNRGISLREAWLQVQVDQRSTLTQSQPNPDKGAARPQGQNSPTGVVATTTKKPQPKYAEPSESFDDIIKGVMAEHGIK